MATSNRERRNQAMLGDLPQDFLRIGPSPDQQQMVADQQLAQSLQAQQAGVTFASSTMAKLCITVVQAKLSKNYGFVKMDPYCRIRMGHSVFETHTAHNGGKNPRWNKTIQCYIPKGIDALHLEIFDERAFSMDDRVAWALIQIPQKVFNGEALDDWFVLNGKQGDGKEGMVNLVMEYTANAQPPAVNQPLVYNTGVAPVMVIPSGMPIYTPQMGVGQVGTTYPQQQPPQPVHQQQPSQPRGPLYTDEDVKQVKEMFPDVDEEVIKSLLEVNQGNKDLTINNLLSMQDS